MKSLQVIISEVRQLSEAAVNKGAAMQAQVAQNQEDLKPRYRLTSESKTIIHPISKKKVKLKRILHQDKTIGYGGWIEKKENLDISQKSAAWIDSDAMVFDDARVEGDADITGFSIIFGDAKIFGDAVIDGSEYGKCAISTGSYDSNITDDIKVTGIDKSKFIQWAVQLNNSFGNDWQSLLINNTDYSYTINTDTNGVYVSKKFKDPVTSRQFDVWQIKRKSDDKIGGWIQDDDNLSEQAWVNENAIIIGNARVYGDAVIGIDKVTDKPTVIFGNAVVKDTAKIGDNVKISGDAVISGTTKVGNGAVISSGTHKDIIIKAKTDITIDTADWIDSLNKNKESNYSIAFKNGKPVSGKIKDPISDTTVTVFQIENRKSKKLGGFIQNSSNLLENAWVEIDAVVFGDAKVFGSAVVKKHAMVFGNAIMSGKTIVGDGARVSAGTHKDIVIPKDAVIEKMDRETVVTQLLSYKPTITGKKYRLLKSKKKSVKNISKKRSLLTKMASGLNKGNEDVNEGSMVTVYQIQRIADDSLGGWIESEDNLDQGGKCWVTEDSIVYGNAKVQDNAIVIGSIIYDNAVIKGKNTIVSDSKIGGDVVINNKDIDGVTSAKFGTKLAQVGSGIKMTAKGAAAVTGAGAVVGKTLQDRGLLF